MRANLMDILSGLERKPNPDIWQQVILLSVALFFIVSLATILFKLPKIKRALWDKDLFKFLIGFRDITERETAIIENMLRKYNIKKKYTLLVMESLFQKYLDMEMINIENMNISAIEKERKIEEYINLKEKLFYKE